jgi:hypothetical protein
MSGEDKTYTREDILKCGFMTSAIYGFLRNNKYLKPFLKNGNMEIRYRNFTTIMVTMKHSRKVLKVLLAVEPYDIGNNNLKHSSRLPTTIRLILVCEKGEEVNFGLRPGEVTWTTCRGRDTSNNGGFNNVAQQIVELYQFLSDRWEPQEPNKDGSPI